MAKKTSAEIVAHIQLLNDLIDHQVNKLRENETLYANDEISFYHYGKDRLEIPALIERFKRERDEWEQLLVGE